MHCKKQTKKQNQTKQKTTNKNIKSQRQWQAYPQASFRSLRINPLFFSFFNPFLNMLGPPVCQFISRGIRGIVGGFCLLIPSVLTKHTKLSSFLHRHLVSLLLPLSPLTRKCSSCFSFPGAPPLAFPGRLLKEQCYDGSASHFILVPFLPDLE